MSYSQKIFTFELPATVDGKPMVESHTITAQVDDLIHEEDAWRFFARRLFSLSKDPVKTGEDMIIDSMCESWRLGRPWTVPQLLGITPARTRRLAKGWQTRLTTLSPIQDFILKNWRAVRLDSDFPGLWEWNTSAAVALIEAFKYVSEMSNEAYDQQISKMGLSATRKPAAVTDCRVLSDGKRIKITTA